MINKNEENFRSALKILVQNEPEKLAFFNVLRADSEIPPFVPIEPRPAETAYRHRQKQISFAAKRRRYNFGMAAAAACLVAFLSLAVANSGPGMPNDSTASDGGDVMNITIQDPSETEQAKVGTEDIDDSEVDAVPVIPKTGVENGEGQYKNSQNEAVEPGAAIGNPEVEVQFTGEETPSSGFPLPLALAGLIICAVIFALLLVNRRKLN